MRILWLGTKCPWPPADGGRLLSFDTIRLLSRRHQLTVVVPGEGKEADGVGPATAALGPHCALEVVPVRPRPPLVSLAATALGGRPFTIDRHRHAAVDRRVEQLLGEGEFDLVHAEQLHALPPGGSSCWRLPVLLREQNVECDLWHGAARFGTGLLARGMAREARRLERWEASAVARSALTVTLTGEDRLRLLSISGQPGEKVVALPVPFRSAAEAGAVPLEGSPSVVLFGSGGWRPNSDGARWFLRSVWPGVAGRLPGAVLHLFGEGGEEAAGPSLRVHPAPADVSTALAAGSVCVVPLRFASGIRMRILDAWSRGVPVVATPVAAAGPEGEDGTHLLLAGDAGEFAAALRRLSEEPLLGASLAGNARDLLRRRHLPEEAVARLEAAYSSVVG